MAISAMADMMKITKRQFVALRDVCLVHAEERRSGKDKITIISRESLVESMHEVNLDANDKDVLDHLFTMFDKSGESKVDVLLFFASVAPLASTMDVETKLLFAFEIFDDENSGRLKKSDAKAILTGINATASYFGDAVLNSKAVDIIVDDVFKSQAEIYYEEYMDLFANHPPVMQFASSGGTMKYSK